MDRSTVVRDRIEGRMLDAERGGALVGLETSTKISGVAVLVLFVAPIGYGVWMAAKGKFLLGLAMATVGPFASLWAAGKIVEAVDG